MGEGGRWARASKKQPRGRPRRVRANSQAGMFRPYAWCTKGGAAAGRAAHLAVLAEQLEEVVLSAAPGLVAHVPLGGGAGGGRGGREVTKWVRPGPGSAAAGADLRGKCDVSPAALCRGRLAASSRVWARSLLPLAQAARAGGLPRGARSGRLFGVPAWPHQSAIGRDGAPLLRGVLACTRLPCRVEHALPPSWARNRPRRGSGQATAVCRRPDQSCAGRPRPIRGPAHILVVMMRVFPELPPRSAANKADQQCRDPTPKRATKDSPRPNRKPDARIE